MIRGSCLCGGIKFEIEKVRLLNHCHCSICRKHAGSSFATFAHVRPDRFKWISGQELINPGYEWMPGHARSFCSRCGSPAPKLLENYGAYSVPAGLLDDDPIVRPSMHVYTSSKVPWIELNDNLEKHERWYGGVQPKDYDSWPADKK
jgi:hypothetical protein